MQKTAGVAGDEKQKVETALKETTVAAVAWPWPQVCSFCRKHGGLDDGSAQLRRPQFCTLPYLLLSRLHKPDQELPEALEPFVVIDRKALKAPPPPRFGFFLMIFLGLFWAFRSLLRTDSPSI